MFIALNAQPPPARFGGAEINLTSTNPVSFRPSEPRLGLLRYQAINISLLRSEEPVVINKIRTALENQIHVSSDSAFFRQTLTGVKPRALCQRILERRLRSGGELVFLYFELLDFRI